MHRLVDRIMSIVDSLDGRKGIVKVCFLDSLPMAIDIMQSFGGVDGYEIRSYPHMGAVLLMQRTQPQMAVALEPMVQLHPRREGRQEWAPNMMQGVEESIVQTISDGLEIMLRLSKAHCIPAGVAASTHFPKKINSDQCLPEDQGPILSTQRLGLETTERQWVG